MNYKNDQFYNDMQNVKNSSLPVQNYISSKFVNFWNSFYTYLTYFQKQVNQHSLFIKGPKGYLSICFEGINKILDKATADFYDESMIPAMTNCFKSMLHPDNVDFIKQAALNFFIIIYPRLKKTGINYTEDFEQYFFDFSFADSSLKITSIDNDIRIQIQDQEPPKTFNSKFDDFLNTIKSFTTKSSEDDIRSWWAFIQKHIICIIFYSIFKNKPQIQGVSNISNFPQETERILINFLNNLVQNGFLKVILQFENSSDYIVDILYYLSQEFLISKINSLEFIKNFMKVLIDTQVNIVEVLYEKNYHLLLELMSVIINCLNFAFSGDNKLIPEFTKIFTTYFNCIYKLFNNDYKYELCTYLSHCEKITNTSCLLHYLTLLLCLFVNNRVMDKKLWDTIVNSDGLFDLNLVLSCFAHFAGYYSTYAFYTLLGLDVEELYKSFISADKLNNYLDLTDQMWSKEFGDAFNKEYQKVFINLRQQLIHSLILVSPGITSIKMIELFPNVQRHFPQKEEALKLLRVMFSSFVWQDKKYENSELNQFYCYLVNASFITPLLKIANVISPDVVFDRNFLIEEFLTFLKNCIKLSGSNLLIKLHSLTTLGNIICQRLSLTALDENSLADWYLTLHNLIINGGDNKDDDDQIKGDLKMKIKLSALTFACRSVILGFKGSSILLKTIADNFDLINQIDSKMLSTGSSNSLNSYLVEEGFEMLTSSDTASLLISLSNICEFSNIFSFNCYNSDSENEDEKNIREKKDELKLKLIKNCIDTIDPSLRATVITSLLSEEAEANRCNETNLNKLLEILFQYFKDSSPEKVYAATTITLVLPELEKVKKGSVETILDEAIDALENRKIENDRDELLFGRFAEFVVDLLIYSSFIIDTQKQLKHFQKVAESWNLDDQNALKKFNDQTKQRLLYAVMSLTSHYLRFPPPTPSFSPTDEEDSIDKLSFSADSVSGLKAASFGSTEDCVIRICDNEIASLLPVGQFTWNFRSVAPEPAKREVSEDVSIGDQIQSVSEQKEQIEFTSKFVDFVDDLYTNHFTEISSKPSEIENTKNDENETQKTNETDNINININDNCDNSDADVDKSKDLENFEVFQCHLYNPSDFDSSSCPSLDSPSVYDIKLYEEKLPPHTVGPRSAAFLSSLDFFDSQLTSRLFPSVQAYRCVEVSEFRHVIHVGFITLKTTENDSHFADFKTGLGLLDESKASIICADSRHQIVFHLKEEGINAHPDVFICWNENESTEEWVNTFDGSKQKLRIEIKPIHSGLFKVSVLVNKSYHQPDLKCLSNVLVSKNNLPNFVIGQIIVNVHILDFRNNKIASLQLQNGIKIREKRKKEFTACPNFLLNCEKTLLTKANSNDDDDNVDDEK